jgi:TRAP-type C4-dicarboxylate transport system permease large subunit
MSETYKGLVPFLIWDILRLAVLLFVPALSLWLVGVLFTR